MPVARFLLILFLFTTATVPEPRIKRDEKSPTLNDTISNHLKLGNILDALFINSKLFKKEITGEKVLTSLYGMPDVKPLRKILEFNEKNFMAAIEKIESELPKIPLNIDPFDLAALENSLPKISFLNSTILNWLRESTLETDSPDVIATDFSDSLRFLWSGSANNISVHLENFKEGTLKAEQFADKLLKIGGFVNFREIVIGELRNEKRERKKWDDLKWKMKYGKWLHENYSHVENFLKALRKSSELMKYLKKGTPFESILQDGLYLQNWYRSLHNPRGELFIGASFIDQRLNKIYELLEEKWVKEILNNGQELEYIRTSLLQMLTFTKQFASVNYYMSLVMTHPQAQYHIDILMDFLIDTKRLHWFAANSKKMEECLTFNLQFYPSFNFFLKDHTSELNQYYEVLSDLSSVLDEHDKDGTLLRGLEEIQKHSESQIKEIVKNWNDTKSSEFGKIEAILTDYNYTGLFSALKSSSSNMMSVSVFLFYAKIYMDIIKQWILWDKASCDSWVPMELGNFTTYNLFPQTHKRLIDSSFHSNFKEFFAKIKALREELQLLESAKVLKPGLLIQNEHRQFQVQDTLMEVGNIFRTLHNIQEIHLKMEDLKTILEIGDHAVQKKEKVKHPRHKVILDSAWKDWSNMKEDLGRIQMNVEEVVRIFDVSPEFSLKDIGKKYIAISKIRFTKGIYHNPYFNFGEKFDSLRLLDESDSNIQRLNKSLESLRKPMNIDWAWAGDRFGNLALFMEDVERAMKEFHKLKAPIRRHSKWQAWLDQKRKKEQEEKNKLWVDYIFHGRARYIGVGVGVLGAQIGLLIYFLR